MLIHYYWEAICFWKIGLLAASYILKSDAVARGDSSVVGAFRFAAQGVQKQREQFVPLHHSS